MAGRTLSPDRLARERSRVSSEPLLRQVHRRMWHANDRDMVRHDDIEDHVFALWEAPIAVGNIIARASYRGVLCHPLKAISDLIQIGFGLGGSPLVQRVVGNRIQVTQSTWCQSISSHVVPRPSRQHPSATTRRHRYPLGPVLPRVSNARATHPAPRILFRAL